MARHPRMKWLSLVLAALLLLAQHPMPAPASWRVSEDDAPGATGAATLRGVSYLYARRGDGAVWVRKTDGLWYSGWSSLGGATDLPPAAASAASFVAVFARGLDGTLWASRTVDGYTYEGWRRLGDPLAATPAAVGFGRRIYVFARDADGMLWVRDTMDGRDFSPPTLLGGPLSGAPVPVVLDGALTVFGRDGDGRLYSLTARAGEDERLTWANWLPRNGDVPQAPPPAWREQPLPPLALDLGINFISALYWREYQLPDYERLRPTLAKFSLFYDGDITRAMFGPAEIDDAIARGARTVIFRTAETRIGPEEVDQQLNTPLPGDSRSILGYIRERYEVGSRVEFWIEVGNEPDLAGISPLVARYALLATARDVAEKYRVSYPNLHWMASLPTRDGLRASALPDYRGLAYLDLLLSDQHDGLGDVASRYEALGVHLYGADTLQQSFPALHEPDDLFDCAGTNGDARCPTAVLDRVLSRTDRPVFITEAGINSAMSWSIKAKLYLEALYRLPARVRGFAIFTLSLDPEWYAGAGAYCSKLDTGICGRYALDVDERGVVDEQFTGATDIGRCQHLPPGAAGGEPAPRPVKAEQNWGAPACSWQFARDGAAGERPPATPRPVWLVSADAPGRGQRRRRPRRRG